MKMSQEIKENQDWQSKLRMSGKKVRENSSVNAKICIENTEELSNMFRYNEFNRSVEKFHGVDDWGIKEGHSDEADVSIIDYQLENKYNFVFPEKKVSQAMLVIAKQNAFNPVKDWIEEKPWDGKKRGDSFFIDTLGANDSAYVREITHIFLLELVSRVYHPGAKADIVPMLHSKLQGIGKSTVLRKLCPSDDEFDDSLLSLGMTKDDYDEIQGKLVVEIGELSAMKKTGIARVKQFITSQSDKYREPYAKTNTSHKRTCVFAGTTNQSEFLTDRTGNRRFALIECKGGNVKISPFDDNREYYQQLLAEAKTWYDNGEKPVMSEEIDKVAKELAEVATVEDIEEERIILFLNMKVPTFWHDLTKVEKRNYFLHRNDRKFIGSLQKKIDKSQDDCSEELDFFSTVECLNVVFNINTDISMKDSVKKLQNKISSVANKQGWLSTNHIPPEEIRGYQKYKDSITKYKLKKGLAENKRPNFEE